VRAERPETGSPEATEELAARLAARLGPGDVVRLEGELAAGKTTFVRGLVRGLGGDPEAVSSPSFVLVETYPCAGRVARLHHVDLYRVRHGAREVRGLGLEELLSDPDAVVAVEWPRELLEPWLPAGARVWRVWIEDAGRSRRLVEIVPPGGGRSSHSLARPSTSSS